MDTAVAENTALTAAPTMYTNKDVKFSFKKADELGNKRPPVSLKIPAPTIEAVVAFLNNDTDGKNKEYLLDLLAEQIKEQARQQVADDDKPVNSQEELDLAKLTLEYISHIPASERKAGGIDKEVWAAFAKDYIAVMPGVTGKSADAVGVAADLLAKRFRAVANRKDVLKKLAEYLELWFTSTTPEKQEEFADVYEFLSKKAKELLAATDTEQMLANLQAGETLGLVGLT